MLTRFRFKNFKSFHDAELMLSPLTVLIGANASGKSNAIEGLQLLSWLAEGRRLGDLYSSIREQELSLRGSLPRLSYNPGNGAVGSFLLGCSFDLASRRSLEFQLELGASRDGLRIEGECLTPEDSEVPHYWVVEQAPSFGSDIKVAYNNFARGGRKPQISCVDFQAVFTQLLTPARFGARHSRSQRSIPSACQALQQRLSSILFLDPSPRRMREYSFKTDRQLKGDGSNLSAVLHDLIVNQGQKRQVLGFVRSLPEQDIADIEFVDTPREEVMVALRESFGDRRRIFEAAALSDGTLRVLAVAAALLAVKEGSLVVIEEIDNGVHPSRAKELLARIQQIIDQRGLRVLVTTHNPALLDALPDSAIPNAVACYRDPEDGSSRLIRLEDLDTYPELVAQGPLGHVVTEGILDRLLKSRESRGERIRRNLDWLETLKEETVAG